MPTLTQVERKFILHWGEMGTRWGINRTVAQVHALLYLAPRPLNAEEIAQTLSVARSNVSTSLRELESWRIVKPVHLLGDRREHYETMMDVWEMFRIIVEERKRRELDPTLELLRSCVAELDQAESPTRERLLVMLDFFETMTSCYDEVRGMPVSALQKLVKMKGKITKLLGVKTAAPARTPK
ncbi:MAG: GbsR/MarR family transcriptional regulator [Deltaproteobacteria bacterium]